MLIWVYAAGLAQALFIVITLASLKARNSAARWLLVGQIAVFSIMLLEEFLDLAGVGRGLGLGLAIEFAMGPLFYLFLRSVERGQGDFRWRQILHFLPLVPAALAWSWLYFGWPGHHVSLSRDDMRPIVAAIVFVKIAWFSIYAAAALLPPPVAEPRRLTVLRPLRRLFQILLVVYAFGAAGFVAFYFQLPWMPDSDRVGSVLATAIIFTIGYYALVRREIFDVRAAYQSSALAEDQADRIRRRADAHLDASLAYRDPGLSLGALAGALGISEAHLSQALNTGDAGGFHEVLNRHRLQAFRLAAADPAQRDRTILELAMGAGFNAKATFYRAFAAAEGVTPVQYRAARLAGADGRAQVFREQTSRSTA